MSLEETKSGLALARTMISLTNGKIAAIEEMMKAREEGKDLLSMKFATTVPPADGEGDGDDGKKKKRKYTFTPKFDADGNKIKRKMSGYQLYIKKNLDKNSKDNKDFTSVAAKWKLLGEDEKKSWNTKAAELPEVIEKTGDNDQEDAGVAKTPAKSPEKKEKKEKKKKKKKRRDSNGNGSDFE